MFELMQSLELNLDTGSARGRALVAADHPFLADHFPGMPLAPGSLLIELAAQVAGPLAEEWDWQQTGARRWALLAMVKHAKFPYPAHLPAHLEIRVTLARSDENHPLFKASVQQGTQTVLQGELVMVLKAASAEWESARRARDIRLASWRTSS